MAGGEPLLSRAMSEALAGRCAHCRHGRRGSAQQRRLQLILELLLGDSMLASIRDDDGRFKLEEQENEIIQSFCDRMRTCEVRKSFEAIALDVKVG